MFLAGSVSSIGQPLAPVGTITPDEARATFIEQIEALLEAAVANNVPVIAEGAADFL